MRRLCPLLVCTLLLLSACNVFETFYEEGTSTDAQLLMQDARAALERGDVEKARTYLERAHSKNPDNAEVRIELSSVELQINGISAVRVKELADYVQEANPPLTASGTYTFTNTDRACNFSRAQHPDPPVFDYEQLPAFQQLKAHEDVLARVNFLLAEVEASGLARRQHARLLLMDSIVRIARATLALQDAATRASVSLHRLSTGAIGACADSDELLAAFEGVLKCELVAELFRARDGLQQRLDLLNNPENAAANDILDALTEAIHRLGQEVDLDCTS